MTEASLENDRSSRHSDLGQILFALGAVGISAELIGSFFGLKSDPALIGAFSTFCLVGGGFSVEGRRRGNGN